MPQSSLLAFLEEVASASTHSDLETRANQSPMLSDGKGQAMLAVREATAARLSGASSSILARGVASLARSPLRPARQHPIRPRDAQVQ